VHANWKLIFENYSECYHCPGVHPALSKISPYDSAENDLCEGPFLGGFMAIARGKSLTMSGKACARPVGDIKGENHARVFYYSIFPNMLLSMHPDYVMVHQLWPQSPKRTLIECNWYFHPEAAGVPGYNPDDAVAFWDMTNKQDWHVCELSQQGSRHVLINRDLTRRGKAFRRRGTGSICGTCGDDERHALPGVVIRATRGISKQPRGSL
jgi:Rieske 2Fe-2S family protein